MFFDTVEIRWFKKGEIPEAIKTWYCSSLYRPLEQPARTDYYHRQIAGGKLGIKLREGMIEIKQFQKVAGWLVCGNGKIRGNLERWRKWSFKLSEGNGLIAAITSSQDWTLIEKKRWLRRYTISGKEIFGMEQEVNDGCALELSEVRHHGIKWWSLCFETFGRMAPAVTRRMAKKIVPIAVPFELSENEVASYPKWLEKIMQK